MKYYTVRFCFEDNYYLTSAVLANNKEEAFNKFTYRYPNCKIEIENIIEKEESYNE